MVKVLHIISSLDQGGTETVLCRLVTKKNINYEYIVISLKGGGYYEKILIENNIKIININFGKNKKLSNILKFIKLISIIKEISPDVVQTWLYHADLFGGIAARLAGCRHVVWGIRTTSLSQSLINYSTRRISFYCALLSKIVPTKIVTCSIETARIHIKKGYDSNKFKVISNGFNCDEFYYDKKNTSKLRLCWGVKDSDVLLGCVARWDLNKDHDNLFKALSILMPNNKNIKCILVGGGLNYENQELINLINKYEIMNKLILVGPRGDIRDIMNAVDYLVLSSASEAFPNVVGEAMACTTPCIVTDVGDSAHIVGNTGWVVDSKNPEELANKINVAIETFGSIEDDKRRKQGRERILKYFSFTNMHETYLELWKALSLK